MDGINQKMQGIKDFNRSFEISTLRLSKESVEPNMNSTKNIHFIRSR